MAYVLRSVKIPGSKYLNILIVISYLSPPFIGAYAWIQLLGRNGFVTQIINSILALNLTVSMGLQGSFLFCSAVVPSDLYVCIWGFEESG